MRKIVLFISLVTFFFFFINFGLLCDEREENLDIFLVLDKSLSMEEEINAVKSYVNDYVIDELIIPGDMFIIIAFYGKAEIIFKDENVEKGEKEELKERVNSISANGRFTDIGNALDSLQNTLKQYKNRDRKRYMLLLTDGIQEAPPDSEYYTEDGSFNHAFLENTKTIQKEGWKIQVLGIGTASAAKEIAEQLAGEYAETSEEPTKEELTEKTEELLGAIRMQGEPTIRAIGKSGETELKFEVASENYTTEKKVTIGSILLGLPSGKEEKVRTEPFIFSVEPESTKTVTIPISVSMPLDPGEKTGTLRFHFTGNSVMVPAVAEVEFRVKSFLENNIWIIPVGIIILAALVVGIILIAKTAAANKALSFRIFVDNVPISKEPVKIKQDEERYLVLNKLDFSVSEQREEGAVAEFTTDQNSLFIRFFEHPDIKVMDEVPDNVLGEKIRIRLKGGYKTLLFRVV